MAEAIVQALAAIRSHRLRGPVERFPGLAVTPLFATPGAPLKRPKYGPRPSVLREAIDRHAFAIPGSRISSPPTLIREEVADIYQVGFR